MNIFLKLFCTLFYSGFVPKIGGTIGSIVSFLLIYCMHFLSLKYLCHLFLFIVIFLFSLKLIEIYIKKVKKKDPKEVVIDEFLGIYFGYLFMIKYELFSLKNFIIFFIFFRIFDILKPFPISFFDKNIENSFGIIFDDILAGFFAFLVFYAINSWL